MIAATPANAPIALPPITALPDAKPQIYRIRFEDPNDVLLKAERRRQELAAIFPFVIQLVVQQGLHTALPMSNK